MSIAKNYYYSFSNTLKIQSTSFLKKLSCLILNLDNAWGEVQWDTTCLFDCLEPQKQTIIYGQFFQFCSSWQLL